MEKNDKKIAIKKHDNFPKESKKAKFKKDEFNSIRDYALYLKKEIDNYLDFKYKLKSKYAPTVCELVRAGYSEFIKSFYEDGIIYSEILSEINLKQKRVKRKREINTLVNELRNITNCLKSILNLEPDQAPNTNQLINLGYRGLVVFIQKYNFEYSKIAKLASLEYRNWKTDLLNYNDMLRIAQDKGIIFPYTRRKFNKFIEEREISPSHIRFNWICPQHGVWKTSYTTLSKAKYSCPECYRESTYISYEDCLELAKSKEVNFAMTRDEFEKVKSDKKNRAKKESKKSNKISDIPLKWSCEKHGIWMTPYSILRNTAVGCPECGLET